MIARNSNFGIEEAVEENERETTHSTQHRTNEFGSDYERQMKWANSVYLLGFDILKVITTSIALGIGFYKVLDYFFD